MKINKLFDKRPASTVGFGESSKTVPTATSNAFVRCETVPNKGDGGAMITITPMDGYEVIGYDETAEGVVLVAVYPKERRQPVRGHSYMLDGKEVAVGAIDRDEEGNAVAVYDEHTGEKHLWPAKPAGRI